MKLADSTAGAVAYRHSGGPAVTAAMDEMTFLAPVHVGDIIKTYAQVNWAGTSSMEIGVRVEAQPWGNATDEPRARRQRLLRVRGDRRGRAARGRCRRWRPRRRGRTPPARGRDPAGAPAGAQGRDRPRAARRAGVSDWRHVRTTRLLARRAGRRRCSPTSSRSTATRRRWRALPVGPDDRPGGGTGRWSVRAGDGSTATGWRTGRSATRTAARSIGRGGCALPDEALDADPTGRGWWNLYYRFDQRSSAAATPPRWVTAALGGGPGPSPRSGPVLAYLLEHNHASRRTAEKARPAPGLARARTPTTPIRDAVRLVYLDRESGRRAGRGLAREGMPPAGLVG